MQTLWTRLAQSRPSCRCPSCTSSASGITAKRSGAAASRQTSRYLTSSTLLYSGIFAAAATADAGVKQRRRDQWDRAIADVKRELAQSGPAIEECQKVEETSAESLVNYSPLDAQGKEEDVFQGIYPWHQKPMYPANTGPRLNVHHLPPQSIYAEDELKDRAGLRAWTPGKLERVRLATDILQLNIIKALHERGWSEEAAASVPESHGAFIRDAGKQDRNKGTIDSAIRRRHLARRTLREAGPGLSNYQGVGEDGFTLSRFEQDERGDFREVTKSLNHHLQELFRQHRSSAITTPALLGRLSYNLAASSVPPNIETFNTLLRGFSSARQHEFAHEVVHALRYTHMRPNEVTLSTVLNLSSATNNSKLFNRWLRYIEGGSGGLSLARPDIVINDAGRDRLARKEDGKVVQSPYPTPQVFSAVIQGVLKFSGFDIALSKCKEMGMQGWGLCIGGLRPLLRDCANRGDWKAGYAVWNEIKLLEEQGRAVNPGDQELWIDSSSYESMLKLCVAADMTERSQEIWEQAIRVYPHKAYKFTSSVIQFCANSGHWTAARNAWNRINEHSLRRETKCFKGPKLDAPAYAAMLKVCRQTDDLTLFTEVWGQAERCRLRHELSPLLEQGADGAASSSAEQGEAVERISNSLRPYGDVGWDKPAQLVESDPEDPFGWHQGLTPPVTLANEQHTPERKILLRRKPHKASEERRGSVSPVQKLHRHEA